MEGTGESSPGLPPDPSAGQAPPPPAQAPPPRVQSFQEPFIAGSPQIAPQSQASPELKRTPSKRSRATSGANPIIHQPQPIRDAVDKAFDQSTGNHLDPAFIAQVTEAVVKNLQTANLASSTPAPSGNVAYPPPPSVHSVPQSPTQSSTASLPNRYTPPSPHRNNNVGSHGSASPEPAPSEAGSTYSRGSYQSFRSKHSDRDGDTPKPPGEDQGVRRSNTGRRRTQDGEERFPRRQDSGTDQTATGPSRRDSEDSVSSQSSQQDASRSRARPAKVLSPVQETTTLEKIWQPLFDNGNPTVRLSQFLRGIALHLIDDYEPRHSLVVTPGKMLRFFEETQVESELYPWHLIFGGAMTSPSISVMYRRLLCQHHLVQIQYHEVPTVPGLTPAGFEAFLTTIIQAHPDGEFERLAKAVMNMPISNADIKSERFPKELSRRLLPSLANPLAEQRIIASMAHEAQLLQLKNSTTMPPPPPPPSAPTSSFQERERKPYSHTSFSNAVDDDDLAMPSIPIERERKPYFAKEGTGKQYEGESDPRPDSNPYATQIPPRPVRQNSGPMPSSSANGTPSDPRSIPQQSRPRISTGPGTPFQPGSYSRGRRSPPPMNAFARSEPIGVGDIPASQYVSNLHNPRTPNNFDREPDENPLHRFPSRRGNNSSSYDDDLPTRGKPIPSRNGPPPPPPNGYDSTYMSTAPPVGGPYPSRPRPTPTYDNRRHSQYGPGSMSAGPGGSDGWGSFANGYPPQSYGGTVQH